MSHYVQDFKRGGPSWVYKQKERGGGPGGGPTLGPMLKSLYREPKRGADPLDPLG